MIRIVVLTRRASENLSKVPWHIAKKLDVWIEIVQDEGLQTAKKIRGFRDEALQGERFGQRSIRLSRAYRAIYRVVRGETVVVLIEEVNKHEY